MAVLDDLSGFEFEDLMEDVFRKLGYENVRQAERTADEGRDVLMEEVVDGTRRAIVVECKHTGVVGRPVVQKLHSAVATFDFDGPRRGMVVTTGRFTGSAREYVERPRENDDPHPIELIEGEDLREIADEIGLDLYNGRIEILCEETLRPTDPSASVDVPIVEAFRDVENIDESELPEPYAEVTFRPAVAISANIDAVFETSVGVIHRIHERPTVVVHADRGRPSVADHDLASLVEDNLHATIELDLDRFEDDFDEIEERRFGQTETEYKDWAVERLRRQYTTTVTYTGDNNVTYNKECEPNLSDISIQSIEPVYVPEVRQTTDLQSYSIPTSTSRRVPRGLLSRMVSIGACTARRAGRVKPTRTVRTAGPLPVPAIRKQNDWRTHRSVPAVLSLNGSRGRRSTSTTRKISRSSEPNTRRCRYTGRRWRTRISSWGWS